MTHELPATTLDDLLHRVAAAVSAGDIAATTAPIVELYSRMRARDAELHRPCTSLEALLRRMREAVEAGNEGALNAAVREVAERTHRRYIEINGPQASIVDGWRAMPGTSTE